MNPKSSIEQSVIATLSVQRGEMLKHGLQTLDHLAQGEGFKITSIPFSNIAEFDAAIDAMTTSIGVDPRGQKYDIDKVFQDFWSAKNITSTRNKLLSHFISEDQIVYVQNAVVEIHRNVEIKTKLLRVELNELQLQNSDLLVGFLSSSVYAFIFCIIINCLAAVILVDK